MLPNEKEQLLSLLQDKRAWCQDSEARDGLGEPVRFDDNSAVSWDLTGALCRLFGWSRACTLFQQIERHILGQRRVGYFERSPELLAMGSLQEYNDRPETTFERLVGEIHSMPVWRGRGEEAENKEPDQHLETHG